MAIFINRYSEDFRLFLTRQFEELDSIFSGGQTSYDDRPLIVSVDQDGEFEWGMIFNVENGDSLYIKGIYKLRNGHYIAHARNENGSQHFVIGFQHEHLNFEPYVLWCWELIIEYQSEVFILPHGNGFYVVQSSVDFNNFHYTNYGYFEEDSVVGYGHEITENFITKDVHITERGLVFCFEDIDSNAYIGILDTLLVAAGELPILIKIGDYDGAGYIPFPLKISTMWTTYTNTEIIVNLSGRSPEHNDKFFSCLMQIEFNPDNIEESVGLMKIYAESEYKDFNLNGGYLCEYYKNSPHSIIHLLDDFSKRINFDVLGIQVDNPIVRIGYAPNDFLVFNYDDDCIIARTYRDLETELTEEADPLIIVDGKWISAFFDTFNIANNGREYYPRNCHIELTGSSYVEKFLSEESEPPIPPDPTYPKVDVSDKTLLQSPYTTLIASGSKGTGSDGSLKGIHLRWLFNGTLGENHLPKNNYAGNRNNFNKPNDYVRIVRTPYNRKASTLKFSDTPIAVDTYNAVWTYKINNKTILVKFTNKNKYANISSKIDPFLSPQNFIKEYGNNLIEIESTAYLFFGVKLNVSGVSNSSQLRMEGLSVEGGNSLEYKVSTLRKKYSGNELQNVQFLCENGKIVRFEINNALITSLELEFYLDIINNANSNKTWKEIGNFAINLDNTTVFKRLEPAAGLIHAKWPRFNDGEYVNIENYKYKWNRNPSVEGDRNIKQIVERYIELSNDLFNPKAFDNYTDEENGHKLPLLDVLNIGALDYHIARMLGLGTIDYSTDVTTSSQQFMYLLEYYTFGKLENNLQAEEVQHIYLSLPTSFNDERLPLPVEIEKHVPGIVNDEENTITDSGYNLIDSDGYTPQGQSRYITLISKKIPDNILNPPFFHGDDIESNNFTYPVYAGVEYRKNEEIEWIKPELSFDPDYRNVDSSGKASSNETVPHNISENKGIIGVHKQRVSGMHYYGSYGINLFSRAVRSGKIEVVETQLTPPNTLKYPVNIQALFIRKENPLFLTSGQDQNRLEALQRESSIQDKTLVRLTFDYNTQHEVFSYLIDSAYENYSDAVIENNETIFPNNEVYADYVDVFFSKNLPAIVSGGIAKIEEDNMNPLLSVIKTEGYQSSSGEVLTPVISSSSVQNFVGGVLTIDKDEYVIEGVSKTGTNPVIKIYKKEVSDKLLSGESIQNIDISLLEPTTNDTKIFSIVENMQNTIVWNNLSGLLKVNIGTDNWNVKREVIHEGELRFLEKSRGFWEDVIIEEEPEPVEVDDNNNFIYEHRGLYKVSFKNFELPLHNQYSTQNNYSVEFYNGQVRLVTEAGIKRTFPVVRIDETTNPVINTTPGNLVLYIEDASYQTEEVYDKIRTGIQNINYYPGYKVFLYANSLTNLNEKGITPKEGEGIKYSVFGLRSCKVKNSNIPNDYCSRISTPAVMFVQEIITPLQPDLPLGGKYTTRPDTFGRASYTLKSTFIRKPYSIIYARSNDQAALSALYGKNTIDYIRYELSLLGGNFETFVNNRWINFFDFEGLKESGDYEKFPKDDTGFKFPMPDKTEFINEIISYIEWYNQEYGKSISINIDEIESLNQRIIHDSSNNTELFVIDFVKTALYNTFTLLTGFPVVYQYIKDYSYIPQSKKQHIKTKEGYLLSPSSPDFEMAPMARLGKSNSLEVLFTDFTIDGTSDNLYFYSLKEINNLMEMSDYSPVLGPIKTVNTDAPSPPEIRQVLPIMENTVLEIKPSVQFEINPYPVEYQVKRVALYRADNLLDAQSVRTMSKVKIVDFEEMEMIDNAIWRFTDEFEDLSEAPYNDPLYYRIVALRKIEYADEEGNAVIEYAPSKPSKITITFVVESSTPEAPDLQFTYDEENSNNEKIYNVELYWEKTTYKGKYYVYKMNSQDNWEYIAGIDNSDNNTLLTYTLPENLNPLIKQNEGGEIIYHHFKVVAENTSGMLSEAEKILTI